REQRLAERERELAEQIHRFRPEREAFDAERQAGLEEIRVAREALTTERGQLRQDVVAGVQRDHAELLREIGELEIRRRTALAMLTGLVRTPRESPGPPAPRPPARRDLVERLQTRGITMASVAAAAGCTVSNVSGVLSGRTRSSRVIQVAEALITQTK